MRLLSDAHKAAAFVFSELYIKMLPFDLEFFRYNYIIHDAFGGLPLKKPYYPLPIGGGVLLNDTKFLCGKTINSALRPIQMLILLILR